MTWVRGPTFREATCSGPLSGRAGPKARLDTGLRAHWMRWAKGKGQRAKVDLDEARGQLALDWA